MENNIIDVDCTIVQERTPEAIVAEIKVFEQQVIGGMVEIGRRLFEIKEMVGHGNWYGWIGENLGYSERNVQNFMKIAEKYGDENSPYLIAISKTQKSAHLSISKALALLQVPEDVVENFTENNDIPDMTVKEIEAEAKKLKAENEALEKKISEMSAKADSEKNELEQNLETVKAEKEETYKLLQGLQEEALKANNGELSPEAQAELDEKQAEIDKLQKDLEKKQKAETNLKDKIAKADEEKQKAIEEATTKAKEEAQKLAEDSVADTIERITSEKEQALERVANAEKKLTLSNNEDMSIFKVKVDDLQITINSIKNAISNIATNDQEQSDKMRAAFKKLMSDIYDGI